MLSLESFSLTEEILRVYQNLLLVYGTSNSALIKRKLSENPASSNLLIPSKSLATFALNKELVQKKKILGKRKLSLEENKTGGNRNSCKYGKRPKREAIHGKRKLSLEKDESIDCCDPCNYGKRPKKEKIDRKRKLFLEKNENINCCDSCNYGKRPRMLMTVESTKSPVNFLKKKIKKKVTFRIPLFDTPQSIPRNTMSTASTKTIDIKVVEEPTLKINVINSRKTKSTSSAVSKATTDTNLVEGKHSIPSNTMSTASTKATDIKVVKEPTLKIKVINSRKTKSTSSAVSKATTNTNLVEGKHSIPSNTMSTASTKATDIKVVEEPTLEINVISSRKTKLTSSTVSKATTNTNLVEGKNSDKLSSIKEGITKKHCYEVSIDGLAKNYASEWQVLDYDDPWPYSMVFMKEEGSSTKMDVIQILKKNKKQEYVVYQRYGETSKVIYASEEAIEEYGKLIRHFKDQNYANKFGYADEKGVLFELKS